jgi:beta-1,4-mannosyltransferase
MRAATARSIRVVSFPNTTERNPYPRLFYEALRPHGVSVAYVGGVNDTLLGPERAFDVLHFHWSIERIWNGRGSRSPLSVARGLFGWQRFLRRARRSGVRIVWTAHELEPAEGGSRLDRVGYAMCARAADLCNCHAQCCRDAVVRAFRVDPARTVVIPHGTFHGIFPDPRPRAEALTRFEIPPGRRILLCFGDLRPRKGVETAIDAARVLGSSYHLVVAGGAPNAEANRWLNRVPEMARGVSNVTLHLQRLDNQELGDLIHGADCVVLPYAKIFVSGAFSAALALGQAVVASDLPYFREILAGEPDAGVLSPPGSPVALA